jgi:hypothetical protein
MSISKSQPTFVSGYRAFTYTGLVIGWAMFVFIAAKLVLWLYQTL